MTSEARRVVMHHPDDEHAARRRVPPAEGLTFEPNPWVPRGVVFVGDPAAYLAPETLEALRVSPPPIPRDVPERIDLGALAHAAWRSAAADVAAARVRDVPPPTVYVVTDLGPGDAPALVVAGSRVLAGAPELVVGAPFPMTRQEAHP